MIRNIAASFKDKRLATFAVFIPMLLSDHEKPPIESAKKLTEAGLQSYWDGGRSLGKAYGKTVKLPMGKKVAWDVYFLYGPDAVWKTGPPVPVFWMHQLGTDDRFLDANKFRAAVEEQLNAIK